VLGKPVKEHNLAYYEEVPGKILVPCNLSGSAVLVSRRKTSSSVLGFWISEGARQQESLTDLEVVLHKLRGWSPLVKAMFCVKAVMECSVLVTATPMSLANSRVGVLKTKFGAVFNSWPVFNQVMNLVL